jgi:hypothetical protein
VKFEKELTMATKAKRTQQSDLIRIAPERRYHMIAQAAYYRAKNRGFQDGSPLQDWLEAELEIDDYLSADAKALRNSLSFLGSENR